MQDKIKHRLSEIYLDIPMETHEYAATESIKVLTVSLAEAVMEDLLEKKSTQAQQQADTKGVKEAGRQAEEVEEYPEADRQQVRALYEHR